MSPTCKKIILIPSRILILMPLASQIRLDSFINSYEMYFIERERDYQIAHRKE